MAAWLCVPGLSVMFRINSDWVVVVRVFFFSEKAKLYLQLVSGILYRSWIVSHCVTDHPG